MPVYNRMVIGPQQKPACDDYPTLGTNTASEVSFGTCPSNTWKTNATVGITGTLQAGQEYLWEEEVDQSGSWVTLGRTQSTTSPTARDVHIGSNGGGASETHYWRCRVYVVPEGAAVGSACTGPATSNELSKTGNLCLF